MFYLTSDRRVHVLASATNDTSLHFNYVGFTYGRFLINFRIFVVDINQNKRSDSSKIIISHIRK